MLQIKNYIGGKLVEPNSKKYFDNINPAIGKVYSYIPDSDASDVSDAVASANQAFSSWSSLTAEKRGEYLIKIANLIERDIDKLALAESIDNGKTLKLAKAVDIPRASANFKFFGTAIIHFSSESHHTDNTTLNYTLRQPVGIAGCISPWNLPLYLFTWKIAPALAAGNCVIAKPSEITPMTAFLLSELCIEAGLPAGVLNIVHGYGNKVGQAIVEHPDIPLISFTGGTETGKSIARIAAPMFKKMSLELGGKNANIIFKDCNLSKAVKTTVQSSFSNQGQICLCGSRIYVQKEIYNQFKAQFLEEIKKIKVGNPLDASSTMGAIVSKTHFDKILSYLEIAKQEGGKIIVGGEKIELDDPCKEGYYIAPTVIEGLDKNCRTNQEEIFGPVVTLMPFETEKEAIELANSTAYGLSTTIWTENLNTAHRVAQKIKSGIVWINCWLVRDLRTPFGGVKNSGVGREGGLEALRFFTEPKNICIKLDEETI